MQISEDGVSEPPIEASSYNMTEIEESRVSKASELLGALMGYDF